MMLYEVVCRECDEGYYFDDKNVPSSFICSTCCNKILLEHYGYIPADERFKYESDPELLVAWLDSIRNLDDES